MSRSSLERINLTSPRDNGGNGSVLDSGSPLRFFRDNHSQERILRTDAGRTATVTRDNLASGDESGLHSLARTAHGWIQDFKTNNPDPGPREIKMYNNAVGRYNRTLTRLDELGISTDLQPETLIELKLKGGSVASENVESIVPKLVSQFRDNGEQSFVSKWELGLHNWYSGDNLSRQRPPEGLLAFSESMKHIKTRIEAISRQNITQYSRYHAEIKQHLEYIGTLRNMQSVHQDVKYLIDHFHEEIMKDNPSM